MHNTTELDDNVQIVDNNNDIDHHPKSLLDREKSKSSLSLLWEQVSGGPLNLQSYVDNCWNAIDINIESSTGDNPNTEVKDVVISSEISNQAYKDSGNSSLHDEEQLDAISNNYHSTLSRNYERGIGNKWSLVIQELVETETAYLSSLKEIEEGYMDRILNRDSLEYKKDTDIIFSNWKELSKFHFLFLTELDSSIKRGLEQLGQCFLKFSHQFENLYTVYCINYTRSLNHLNTLKDSDLIEYFEVCQSQLAHKLPLSTYLLKPVQRILKYQLILQKLIQSCKCLNPSPAFDPILLKIEKSLLHALEEMIQVAERINRKQTEEEIIQEILQELRQTNGIVMEHGKHCLLEEMRVIGGSKTRRTILLCDGGIVVAKKIADVTGTKWDIKNYVETDGIKLVENIPKYPLGFHVLDNKRTGCKITLQANDPEMKEEWCTRIKQRIIDSYNHDGSMKDKGSILLDNKDNVFAQQIKQFAIENNRIVRKEQNSDVDEHEDEDDEDLKSWQEMLGKMSVNLYSGSSNTNNQTHSQSKSVSLTPNNSFKSRSPLARHFSSKFSTSPPLSAPSSSFQDPSVYQEERRNVRHMLTGKHSYNVGRRNADARNEMDDGDDDDNEDNLDCRSVLVEVNEEIMEQTIANTHKHRNKEAKSDLQNTTNRNDSESILKSEIETIRMADEDDDDGEDDEDDDECTNDDDLLSSISCGSDYIRRKSCSMDRTAFSSVNNNNNVNFELPHNLCKSMFNASNSKTSIKLLPHQPKSLSYNLGSTNTNQSTNHRNSNNNSIFSSVRGIKNFRSNSDWAGNYRNGNCDSNTNSIKPGIVKSISRLFRGPSRNNGSSSSNNSSKKETISVPLEKPHQSPSIMSIKPSSSHNHFVNNTSATTTSNKSRKPRAPPVPIVMAPPEKPPRNKAKQNQEDKAPHHPRARSTSPTQLHSVINKEVHQHTASDLSPTIPFRDLVLRFQDTRKAMDK